MSSIIKTTIGFFLVKNTIKTFKNALFLPAEMYILNTTMVSFEI